MSKPPSDLAPFLFGLAIGAVIGWAACLFANSPAHGCEVPDPVARVLPADPVQRCAVKTLAGEYGKLSVPQAKAYRAIQKHGLTLADADWYLATAYGPWEGFSYGEATAHGYGCSDLTLAANSLPAHTLLLVERKPGMWQVRRVEDRGARWNDNHWRKYTQNKWARFAREGQAAWLLYREAGHPAAICWVDLFVPHSFDPKPMRGLRIKAGGA